LKDLLFSRQLHTFGWTRRFLLCLGTPLRNSFCAFFEGALWNFF
jgi:hypothetical protein